MLGGDIFHVRVSKVKFSYFLRVCIYPDHLQAAFGKGKP